MAALSCALGSLLPEARRTAPLGWREVLGLVLHFGWLSLACLHTPCQDLAQHVVIPRGGGGAGLSPSLERFGQHQATLSPSGPSTCYSLYVMVNLVGQPDGPPCPD